jgi:hypothetical protein
VYDQHDADHLSLQKGAAYGDADEQDRYGQ